MERETLPSASRRHKLLLSESARPLLALVLPHLYLPFCPPEGQALVSAESFKDSSNLFVIPEMVGTCSPHKAVSPGATVSIWSIPPKGEAASTTSPDPGSSVEK